MFEKGDILVFKALNNNLSSTPPYQRLFKVKDKINNALILESLIASDRYGTKYISSGLLVELQCIDALANIFRKITRIEKNLFLYDKDF
jgi:hypothetical protein